MVAASFGSPIAIKSDVVSNAVNSFEKSRSHQSINVEKFVVGSVEFAKPSSWGVLGANRINTSQDNNSVGTIVAGLCPAGSGGASCKDNTQLTFVSYNGKSGHDLPILSELEEQFNKQFNKSLAGFTAGKSSIRSAADGTRYLDYTFRWKRTGSFKNQRLAAYRNIDGSGVVVMVEGSYIKKHTKTISTFLASAHESSK